MHSLETERLRLRPFREEDVAAYARICADPETMRGIGNGSTLDFDAAWRQVALFLGHWTLRGYGIWAVEEKASGAFVGRIGFYNPHGWAGLELGWLIDRARWGRGLATEGARAALAYGRETFGFGRVISLIRPDNTASIRVAEKLGAAQEGEVVVMGSAARVYVLPEPVG
ncbi:MAG: GNAT family N-acetyltransferase [Proteobacteria bacterium]|nr:GNAT family N-acetyltransferase [Pseudomonadota bacterium]